MTNLQLSDELVNKLHRIYELKDECFCYLEDELEEQTELLMEIAEELHNQEQNE